MKPKQSSTATECKRLLLQIGEVRRDGDATVERPRLGWSAQMRRPRLSVAEIVMAAGLLIFLATLVIATEAGPRAISALAAAGVVICVGAVMILFDYRDSARRLIEHARPRKSFDPGHHALNPVLLRWIGGLGWLIFGVALIVAGLLAAFGAISDPDGVL